VLPAQRTDESGLIQRFLALGSPQSPAAIAKHLKFTPAAASPEWSRPVSGYLSNLAGLVDLSISRERCLPNTAGFLPCHAGRPYRHVMLSIPLRVDRCVSFYQSDRILISQGWKMMANRVPERIEHGIDGPAFVRVDNATSYESVSGNVVRIGPSGNGACLTQLDFFAFSSPGG